MKHLKVRSACVASAEALVTGHTLFPLLDPLCFLAHRWPALAVNWSFRINELVWRLLLASTKMARGSAKEAGGLAGHLNQLFCKWPIMLRIFSGVWPQSCTWSKGGSCRNTPGAAGWKGPAFLRDAYVCSTGPTCRMCEGWVGHSSLKWQGCCEKFISSSEILRCLWML